jgi:hypothetical protein
MASPNVYSGGFNLTGTVFENGPALLQLSPAYLSANVQWVDTINGSNANAGTTPELPVKGVAQAITNISSTPNQLIIIGEGSTETLSGSQAFSTAGTYIIGCGVGATRPRYTCSGSVSLFAASAAGIRFRNIYFPASTAAATARINITAAGCTVRDCYFECGASDTGSGLILGSGSSNSTVRDTTFLATASRPATAITVSSASTDNRFESVVIDGGSFGWTAAAFNVTGAALRIGIEGVSMLRRSDYASITGCTYQLFGLTNDGTSRAVITA